MSLGGGLQSLGSKGGIVSHPGGQPGGSGNILDLGYPPSQLWHSISRG